MGQLVEGKWVAENVLVNHDEKGLYYKRPSVFRDRITADSSSPFPAESGRYHLYCAIACPWAHRAVLFRVLKRLEPHIALWNTHQEIGGEGWSFGPEGHVVPGTDIRDPHAPAADSVGPLGPLTEPEFVVVSAYLERA